jgi:tRNA modification GTPase
LDDPEHISLEGYPERLCGICDEILAELRKLIESAENGRILSEGISTVILGKPNAGKSSLLNMILGQERAIVTDIAGTTRDTLEECVNLGGIQLNVIDTAGIRDTQDQVEKIGVERAKKQAEEADLILYVVDTSVALDENDKEILSLIGGKRTIFLMNKSDLEAKVSEEELLSLLGNVDVSKVTMIPTSAVLGEGLGALEKEIEKLFFEGKIRQNDELVITKLRHKQELQNALDALLLVKKSLEDQMPEDFYSIDLMQAYASLGNIIGEEVGDDLVDEIFSKFCMGK